MGSRTLATVLVATLYLTLGTYAVPHLRVTLAGEEFPVMVILAALLVPVAVLRTQECRQTSSRDQKLVLAGAALYSLASLAVLAVSEVPNLPLTAKYMVMASFPAIAHFCYLRRSDWIRAMWMLGVTSAAVLVLGAYGFFTGALGDPIEHRFGYFGVTYMTSTRNSDALYFMTLFCISFAAARCNRSKLARNVGAVLAICAGAAIVASFSRGAWIATGAALCSVPLMGRSDNPKRVRRSLATVVIILVGIFVSLVEFAPEGETAAIAQRFQTIWQDSSEQGNSNPARLVIISGAADVIAKSWGLGVGVGNLRFSLPAETGQYFNHAENTYLQALAEQGLLGFLGLIILSSYTIKRLVILKRQHTTDWLTEALLMWFVAIAVFQLFNNVLDNSWYWAVFALGVGYAGARERESRQPRIVLLLRSAPSLSPHIVAHTR